jgi:aminoglycoside phosphotransferase (APT) family kinase protein
MHPDQVDVDASAVVRLVEDQFPQWRGLPVERVTSHGTVNALFRVGTDLVARFPLRPHEDDVLEELAAEQAHARFMAPHLPLPVPEPVAMGRASAAYPGPWSVFRWIPGEPAGPHGVHDWETLAVDLADVVRAFRSVPTGGRRWGGRGRGGPLQAHDEGVCRALADSAHLVDVSALAALWGDCLAAHPHAGPDVWIHTDLMPGNLLVDGGRLRAVIDLGPGAVGDPAVGLMPAWNLLPSPARATFREALGVADAMWRRGRGWAIVQAAIALPYYIETNPVMAATARHTLDALVAEARERRSQGAPRLGSTDRVELAHRNRCGEDVARLGERADPPGVVGARRVVGEVEVDDPLLKSGAIHPTEVGALDGVEHVAAGAIAVTP